jgi:peptide/nickel transport system substrate-binding protein
MKIFPAVLLLLLSGLIGYLPADAYKGKVTIALKGEPPTMFPLKSTDFIGSSVWAWSYDTLVMPEPGTGKKVPWLASKWERVTPTATKFWLRKGVKFFDGTPFTTAAVKYAVEQSVAKNSRNRVYFKTHDHIEIIDKHIFIWHSKVPDNGLINRIMRKVHIVNPKVEKIPKAERSRNTFGTGPYILKSWTKGVKMVFEANPNWWANDRFPNRPKTVVLRRIKESSVRTQALLNGEVDIITGVLPQDLPKIEKNPGTVVASIPAVRILFLGFVSKHGGSFADRKVRLAVNYAIDSELIRRTIMGGRADPIGQMFHPWNYSGYNPDKKWYGHDLAKAKSLMNDAGYPNGFKATLIATNGRYPGDKQTCEAVVGMLKKIKLDTVCVAQRWPLFKKLFQAYKKGKRKGPAMYFMGWGNGQGDPSHVLNGTSSCHGSWSGFCYRVLEKAIDSAIGTADPKEQQAAFEHVTDVMKSFVTHKIFYKIHDSFGYSKNVKFQPRHDESIHPWDIEVVKATN